MSEKGFVKLDRKMLSWGWKSDYKMVALWVEILLQANISDREYQGEKFERGTFPTSLKILSQNTGLSIQSVRTCLNRLKSTNEITCKSTHKGIKISVVKWEDYQGGKSVSNTQNNTQSNIQLTRNQHAINTQSTTLEEIKKERNKETKNIYDDSKIKYLKERWLEAGYTQSQVDNAGKQIKYHKLGCDEATFTKLMNIITNKEIANTSAYISTLVKEGEL